MKLKVKMTIEWEEEADPFIQKGLSNGLNVPECKEYFEKWQQDYVSKIETRADNCLPTGYKINTEMRWKP